MPKCAKKMYLLHRTIFSPVKRQFLAVFGRFWPISSSDVNFSKILTSKKNNFFYFFFNFFFIQKHNFVHFLFTSEFSKSWRQMKKSAKNGQKRLKTAKNGKNGKNLRFTSEKMVLCNRYIFVGIFWQNLKKILGTFFSQSLKNPEITSIFLFSKIF